ncbi:MAG: hypothetical protein M3Y13_01945, partial [Armatimonadota bacterium]|nr:hypothetical protein [Armatimonadota bacterium]
EQTCALLHRLRQAGFVCWWRIPGVSFPVTTLLGVETGPHIHGIDPFVPHKRRLEGQIDDYLAGNNGIEVGRYAHRPDPPAACPQTLDERRLLRRMRGPVRCGASPCLQLPSPFEYHRHYPDEGVVLWLYWKKNSPRPAAKMNT